MPDNYSHIPKRLKKGDCYRQAIYYMFAHEDNKNLRLVHGWVSGRGELYGVRFSHAWVEDKQKRECIDPSNNPEKPLVLTDFIYYHIGNINPERLHKYTHKAMLMKLAKTNKCGPWSKKYDEN